MTWIGLLNRILLLCSTSMICNSLLAQATSFAPFVDGHYLDFITTPEDQTILLTTQGSYFLNQKEAMPITTLGNLRIEERLQTCSSHFTFFPLDNGSMVQLYDHGGLDINKKYLDAAIYLRYENGDNWKVTDKIWFRNKDDVNYAFKLFEDYNPENTTYTDGAVFQQVIWLSTAAEGIVRIEKPKGDSRFRVRKYVEGTDLLSNECTALCRYGTNGVIIGHYGGLTCLGDFLVDFSDITVQPVKQILVDDEIIWCLTQDAIIKVSGTKATAIDLPELEEDEKLLRMEIKKDKSLLLLTEESFHLIPYQPFESQIVENAQPERAVQFYQIRSNKYYSDGESVYGYNTKTQEWENHPGKKVPTQVVSEDNRVTLLYGDNTGSVITKDSAKTLIYISETQSDILGYSRKYGKEYHLTRNGIYLRNNGGEFLRLNQEEDSFYKHIRTYDGLEFAFGETGIYQIQDQELLPVDGIGKHEIFPYSQNQFYFEDKLVTFSKRSLKVLDLPTSTLTSVNLAPLKILDILEKEDFVWVLTEKSLISISKNSLLSGEKIISAVLPLNQALPEEARLVNGLIGDQIFVAGKSQLLEIDLEAIQTDYRSQMHLVYIEDKKENRVVPRDGIYKVGMDDLPLTLSFSPNIYSNASAKYSFHLNHEGKNNSVWKNDGQYEFDVEESGKYTLVAKYIDDIYGIKHITESTQLYVSKNPVLATTSEVSLWRVPLILITLLLLWSGWWLKGKLSS